MPVELWTSPEFLDDVTAWVDRQGWLLDLLEQ